MANESLKSLAQTTDTYTQHLTNVIQIWQTDGYQITMCEKQAISKFIRKAFSKQEIYSDTSEGTKKCQELISETSETTKKPQELISETSEMAKKSQEVISDASERTKSSQDLISHESERAKRAAR